MATTPIRCAAIRCSSWPSTVCPRARPLYCHQPRRRPRQVLLRAALLRPRPSREPHQGVEEPPRPRPHLLPCGRGQPVSPVPARWRLLALVVDAPRHAQTFDLARMQFDTLRLRLVKIAARVVELKTQLKIHLPSSAPDQAIFAMLL